MLYSLAEVNGKKEHSLKTEGCFYYVDSEGRIEYGGSVDLIQKTPLPRNHLHLRTYIQLECSSCGERGR